MAEVTGGALAITRRRSRERRHRHRLLDRGSFALRSKGGPADRAAGSVHLSAPPLLARRRPGSRPRLRVASGLTAADNLRLDCPAAQQIDLRLGPGADFVLLDHADTPGARPPIGVHVDGGRGTTAWS